MKDGWVSEKLGSITTKIGSGATPLGGEDSYQATGISLIRSLNVYDDGFRVAKLARIDEGQAERLSNVVVEPNDVLLNITGASVARCCLAPAHLMPARVNQHVSIIRPINETLIPAFLRYLLTSKTYKDRLLRTGEEGGSTRQALTKAQLQEFDIEYPKSVSEQQRIVGILDEAFDSIAKARANAERNLKNARSLVQPMFMATLSSLDGTGWLSTTVEGAARQEKGSIRTGPFGSQLLHSEFVEQGVPVLGIDNAVQNRFTWNERRYITPQKFSELSRYQVRAGDVLITIMGTCGRCAIVPEGIPTAINSKHLCCITLNKQKCLPEFLHAYFLYHTTAREFLSKQAKGAIMAGLNMGLIKELPLLLPRLHQQTFVVAKLADIRESSEKLECTYQSKLKALDELKKSVLNEAFNGNL